MGTRAIVNLYDENQPIVTLYRQYDGYPTGLGQELADIYREQQPICNDSQDLAAMIVSKLKKDTAYNVYLYPIGSRDCGEEFTYNLELSVDELIVVDEYGDTEKLYYQGNILQFNPAAMLEREQQQEAIKRGRN